MYGGMPTFMNFPVCLTQEDLKAGKVDVAILGAPLDMSFGQRGTAFGPRALRTAERYIPGRQFQDIHRISNPLTLSLLFFLLTRTFRF